MTQETKPQSSSVSALFFKFAAGGVAGGNMLFSHLAEVWPKAMESFNKAMPDWLKVALPGGAPLS